MTAKDRMQTITGILTEDSLAEALQGCRILQLMQEADGNEGLSVEARNGVKLVLGVQELSNFIKRQKSKDGVKLLVLAFNDSMRIA